MLPHCSLRSTVNVFDASPEPWIRMTLGFRLQGARSGLPPQLCRSLTRLDHAVAYMRRITEPRATLLLRQLDAELAIVAATSRHAVHGSQTEVSMQPQAVLRVAQVPCQLECAAAAPDPQPWLPLLADAGGLEGASAPPGAYCVADGATHTCPSDLSTPGECSAGPETLRQRSGQGPTDEPPSSGSLAEDGRAASVRTTGSGGEGDAAAEFLEWSPPFATRRAVATGAVRPDAAERPSTGVVAQRLERQRHAGQLVCEPAQAQGEARDRAPLHGGCRRGRRHVTRHDRSWRRDASLR